MIESIAPLITAMTTAIAILSTVWIYRRTRRVDTVHFIFSIGIMIFTMYHLYAVGIGGDISPVYGIINSLFISSVAWVNAYCSTCTNYSQINIGVCRRKETDNALIISDRRKTRSAPVFKHIANLKR